MSRLRLYITLVRRHAHYGNKRQALGYALRHWRFWQGAESSDEPYVHIGNAESAVQHAGSSERTKHAVKHINEEMTASGRRGATLTSVEKRVILSAQDEEFGLPPLVCVLCGAPWLPIVKNRCGCGGFCTWGEKRGGPPSSWDVHEDGSWTAKPVPKDLK